MTDNETIEVYWLTTLAEGHTTPTDASSVTWPQPLATGDECGDGLFQIDTYLVSDVPTLVADNQLTLGEDWNGVVISWRFEEQIPCPVEVTITSSVDCAGNVSVYTDGVLTDQYVDVTLIDTVACAPPPPPELADTGITVGQETALWVALGLVVAGVTALWVRKVRA